MKKLLTAAAILSMGLAPIASAQTPGPPDGRYGQRPGDQGDQRFRPRWSAGDRLPPQYRQREHYVEDWQRRGLRRPPKGYRWVRYRESNYFLVAVASGLIAQTIYRDERDQTWDRRYSQRYTYQDDLYYRECRKSPDPAGVLIGALIGGLIGDAVDDSHGSGGAIAGVILGGAMGAALTRDLDCEDRSYAYRSYYNGFNSGQPGGTYRWRNPRSGRYGQMRVDGYYSDRAGFRCTNFTQTVYINGRPRIDRGRACRQPDGSWAIVN